MVVDTSALVAILLKEDGYRALIDKLAAADVIAIGGPTVAELSLVLAHKLGADPVVIIERALARFSISVVPFGAEHWREASRAFLRFGNGRHRARLNFGDCMTYSVALLADAPLLCVGDDFAATDLTLA